jgi:membrane fusion protein (multidrug efflux system)
MVKLAIVIVAVAALVVLAKLPTRKQEAPPTEVPPVKVTVMTVTAEPQFPDTFDLPAVVEPNQIVTVSAEIDGRVEWIGPQKGAVVRAGDSLIRLNTDLLEAQFQMAQAQAKNNQTEFDRVKGLVEQGAAPSRDLDAAATQLTISTAQLEEVRVRMARARIAAPMSGVLNDIPVEEGEYVTAAPPTSVAEIVDTRTLKVVAEVPERDVPFFSVGQKAQVLLDVKGRPQSVEGTITFLSELADPRTRSTRMEIALPNKEGLLRSGQIVRVRLTRRIFENTILIPLLAVIPMEDSKAVYVVDESSKAQRREVELGIIRGDRVQVTKGLAPGDRLIVSGHRFVAPGQDVKMVPNGSQSKVLP